MQRSANKLQEVMAHLPNEQRTLYNDEILRDLFRIDKSYGFTVAVAFPQDITFEGQENEEYVVLFTREHPIVLAVSLIKYFFGLLIILAGYIGFKSFFGDMQMGIVNELIGTFFVLITFWVISQIMYEFIHWFYNIYIVTNRRIVDIDMLDLQKHNVATTTLTKIQDIKSSNNGLLGSIFNFGDVFIQTAASSSEFDFLNVYAPTQVQNIINYTTDLEKKQIQQKIARTRSNEEYLQEVIDVLKTGFSMLQGGKVTLVPNDNS